MKKYRLLIVDQIVNSGGVERFLEECVRALLSHPEAEKWEIELLVNSRNTSGKFVNWPKELIPLGARVHFLFQDSLHRPFQFLRTPRRILGIPGTTFLLQLVRKTLLKSPFKILRSLAGDSKSYIELFVHKGRFDLGFFAFPFSMDCPRLSIPMVSLPHDLSHKNPEVAPPTAEIIERQLPQWLESSTRLLVSTSFVLREMEKHYPEHAHKVNVVPLGIPNPPCSILSDVDFKIVQSLPNNFLLSSGWITPHKDQLLLIEAVGYLRSKGLRIPIVFTGPNTSNLFNVASTDEYCSTLSARAADLLLIPGKDVYSLGFVNASTLIQLYKSATAFVLTSRYEAGSFPVREAIRQGCPVISSDISPVLDEMAMLNNPALVFSKGDVKELAEKIVFLLDNTEMMKKKAEIAAEDIKQLFTWEQTARRYFHTFELAIRASRLKSV